MLLRFTPVVILLGAATLLTAQQDSGSKFALGAKVSTLGIGVEAGVGVGSRSNVRAAFNFFDYSHTFNKDGITYDGKLKLRSFELRADQYIAGPLHISTGLLVYNGNKASANVVLPGGSSFSLGDVTYYSSAANPVTGTGTLPLNKVAPELLLGIGNLVPRDHHVGVNFEFGVMYQGAVHSALSLNGSTCNASGQNCVPISSAPGFQTNLQAEQNKVDDSLKILRFYPIVSLGLSYRF